MLRGADLPHKAPALTGTATSVPRRRFATCLTAGSPLCAMYMQKTAYIAQSDAGRLKVTLPPGARTRSGPITRPQHGDPGYHGQREASTLPAPPGVEGGDHGHRKVGEVQQMHPGRPRH